jgi:EF hand domain-containing protein
MASARPGLTSAGVPLSNLAAEGRSPMRRLGWAAVLLAFGLSATPVLAQQQAAQPAPQQKPWKQQRRQALQKRFVRQFQRLDTNKDGVISRDEWRRRPQMFDRIDTNHDGVLTRDELRVVFARMIRRQRSR